ncbi:MAG: ribosome silencing factor [Desulfovibrionaceae bacterium]
MKKKYSLADTAEKCRVVTAWLVENKAKDPATVDLTGQCAFAESLIVVTASSIRHAQSLASGVTELCAKENYEFLRVEGVQTGQWILVDMNDIVVNIFQESVRGLYDLESLWNAAYPRLKRDDDTENDE